MGIDPTTHEPKIHALICGAGQSKNAANVRHLAQWESARLESEARLVRESKLERNPNQSQLAKKIIATSPPLLRPPCLDILKVWEWTNPEKGTSTPTLDGFFASYQSLQSPTSTITRCFLENWIPISTVGLFNEYSSIRDINCIQKYPGVGKPIYGNEDEVRDRIGNSVELHDITDPIDYTYVADSLKFPSFVEGFTDLPPSMVSSTGTYDNVVGSYENKINY